MWSPTEFRLTADPGDSDQERITLAEEIYRRVCRVDFDVPGACLVDLGTETTSVELRGMMVALKERLGSIHHLRTGHDLVYQSLGRFDQQGTTKLHRDGGPEESLLMLGYEPSEVASELAMADYAKCAYDMGLSPRDFLDAHNPMFAQGEEVLRPYTWRVEGFSNRRAQVVVINNSIAMYSPETKAWQGVLHTATIPHPSADLRRVVNSSMIVPVARGTEGAVTGRAVEEFRVATVVRRKGYDRPNVDDDV